MALEILYYTDNRLDKTLLGKVVKEYILKAGLPITSISHRPIDFGKNIHYPSRERSHSVMYNQILTGLKAVKADYVFMCEHDVLYHKSHFDFKPLRDDIYYYNNNVWKYRLADRKIIGYDCKWLSQCCASRKILIEYYENKLAEIAKGKRCYGYEPGTGQSKYLTPYKAENWKSEYPNIDIRHDRNWTGNTRMSQEEFKSQRNCHNWQEITIKDIKGWNYQLLSQLAMKYS